MADIAAHMFPRDATLRIRPAHPEDFDAIRRNHRVTFTEHATREPAFDEKEPFIEPFLDDNAGPLARFVGTFRRARSFVLVADLEGEVVGHIAYTRYTGWTGPYAAIVSDVSVAPEHRRSGIGRALLRDMEGREARDGVTAFAASVWPNNTASQSLFKDTGYAPFEGEAPHDSALVLFQKEVPFRWLPSLIVGAKTFALVMALFTFAVVAAHTFG